MKKSQKVTLMVLGTAGLMTGCGPMNGDYSQPLESGQVEVTQNFYTTKEDCQNDWGTDAENCTQTGDAPTVVSGLDGNQQGPSATSGATTGSAGSSVFVPGFYGPRYYWDRSIDRPVALAANGQTRVMNNSYLSQGRPSVAKNSTTTMVSPNTHTGLSKSYASGSTGSSVSRGGFGSSGRASSGGG